jgi:3-hydroxyacyl-[acyl-carrier-protein] dehydratase
MKITELLPQREPFLFVSDQFEILENTIKTHFTFDVSLDFFRGHFPQEPIVPGVILSEHCFQSAAALMGAGQAAGTNLAVVSRIQSAKFKNMVKADESIQTETTLVEEVGPAAYFKSVVKNQAGKKVLLIEFACTLVPH